MPITAPGVNLKNLLPPPAIDPTDRPQEQMTLADMLVHKFKDFVRPVTGKVEHWLNDPEQQANANLLLGGPMGMAHVWHGSPHKFTKFDISKIGTGEGAQAYGHGLYFADRPGTARAYQEALASGHTTYGGVPTHKLGDQGIRQAALSIQKNMDDGLSFNDAKEVAKMQWRKLKSSKNPKLSGESGSVLNSIDKVDQKQLTKDMGNLYKVDLPDESIAKMLDWDKPLSEQPGMMTILNERNLNYKPQQTGAEFYENLSSQYGTRSWASKTLGGQFADIRSVEHGGVQYNIIPSGKGFKVIEILEDGRSHRFDEVMTENGVNSLLLQRSKTHGNQIPTEKLIDSFSKKGIPGIKYLDHGSRDKGKGTYNYVVFDDTLPEILEINGKAFKGLRKKVAK